MMSLNTNKIRPVTYMGEDKKDWIKEQLIYKYRKEQPASTLLDLRNVYQSRRNLERDYAQCRLKPRKDQFVELGKIEY